MSIKKIIIAILFMSGISACSKILDKNPESDLDGSERFKEISDYEFSLIGAYSLFRDTDYYGAFDGNSNAFVTLPDILSDNVEESQESLGNQQVFSRWQYTEDDNQVENTWLAAYGIISQANISMRNLVERFGATEAGAVNRIMGQALTMRAMVHFDVLRYWAENYDRNATSPGIPYITKYDYEQMPSRGTVKETYDHIFEDLYKALGSFSDMDDDINTNGRAFFDEYVAHALLARVHLYANQLDSAIEHATIVIDNFPLATMNEFPLIWRDASLAEVVWSSIFNAGQGQIGAHLYAPDINAAQHWPTTGLLSLYAPGDIRYDAYFADVEDDGGDPRTVVIKHEAKINQVNNPDGIVNFKAFRTAEMYLIRAEAYARKGGGWEATGMEDLNELRRARISGYIDEDLTGAALLNAIAVERRKELVAEGHRWFDLKRTTKTVNRTFCSEFCTLPSTSPKWAWPIPQPEIDANPNIGEQNSGY
jgi:starch-binding outer membrane protein, SusD/RagB family